VSSVSILAENVTKEYRLFSNKSNKLVEIIREKNERTIMCALKDISFSLSEGESLGLLGLNGSGKTTLSNIIAGLVQPTYGRMQVNGEASCISVNVGLNQALTGYENIEYKGLLLGFDHEQIQEMIPKVVEFAGIGEYINQPVKYYSSGMMARLGFAISINIDPDVLVIDEGLSVGDQSFTDKSLAAMNAYRQRGKTIVFVSHSMPQVESFCNKALWLEFGKTKMFGKVKDVTKEFGDFYSVYNKMSQAEKDDYKAKQISGV